MGIKKIARPINQAKNTFVKWLKANKATDIDVWDGNNDDEKEDVSWDYYRGVSGFVGDNLYTVFFEMWEGKVKIQYSDGENRYSDMSVYDFLQLIT